LGVTFRSGSSLEANSANASGVAASNAALSVSFKGTPGVTRSKGSSTIFYSVSALSFSNVGLTTPSPSLPPLPSYPNASANAISPGATGKPFNPILPFGPSGKPSNPILPFGPSGKPSNPILPFGPSFPPSGKPSNPIKPFGPSNGLPNPPSPNLAASSISSFYFSKSSATLDGSSLFFSISFLISSSAFLTSSSAFVPSVS